MYAFIHPNKDNKQKEYWFTIREGKKETPIQEQIDKKIGTSIFLSDKDELDELKDYLNAFESDEPFEVDDYFEGGKIIRETATRVVVIDTRGKVVYRYTNRKPEGKRKYFIISFD